MGRIVNRAVGFEYNIISQFLSVLNSKSGANTVWIIIAGRLAKNIYHIFHQL